MALVDSIAAENDRSFIPAYYVQNRAESPSSRDRSRSWLGEREEFLHVAIMMVPCKASHASTWTYL